MVDEQDLDLEFKAFRLPIDELIVLEGPDTALTIRVMHRLKIISRELNRSIDTFKNCHSDHLFTVINNCSEDLFVLLFTILRQSKDTDVRVQLLKMVWDRHELLQYLRDLVNYVREA